MVDDLEAMPDLEQRVAQFEYAAICYVSYIGTI